MVSIRILTWSLHLLSLRFIVLITFITHTSSWSITRHIMEEMQFHPFRVWNFTPLTDDIPGSSCKINKVEGGHCNALAVGSLSRGKWQSIFSLCGTFRFRVGVSHIYNSHMVYDGRALAYSLGDRWEDRCIQFVQHLQMSSRPNTFRSHCILWPCPCLLAGR